MALGLVTHLQLHGGRLRQGDTVGGRCGTTPFTVLRASRSALSVDALLCRSGPACCSAERVQTTRPLIFADWDERRQRIGQ